jgi:hypothetical protein
LLVRQSILTMTLQTLNMNAQRLLRHGTDEFLNEFAYKQSLL